MNYGWNALCKFELRKVGDRVDTSKETHVDIVLVHEYNSSRDAQHRDLRSDGTAMSVAWEQQRLVPRGGPRSVSPAPLGAWVRVRSGITMEFNRFPH
jgi:hypothetical protein